MDATKSPTLPVKLHCLGGHAAPPEVVADFLATRALPPGARAALWGALVHCLGEVIPKAAQEELDRFCAAHAAPPPLVARAVKGARFVLREAAARDLSAAVLAEDLMAISEGDEEIARLLLSGYDAARAAIRAEIVRLSFGDHGKLLDRVEWRMDHVTTSSRGEKLRVPSVVMTFSYTEGDQKARLTLHMPTDAVRGLRAMCDKILAST